MKSIIRQVLLACALVTVAFAYEDEDFKLVQVDISEPVVISTSYYDIDHDGKKEKIEIIMNKGVHIVSDVPWCGGGERWEGNFIIQVRKGHHVIFKQNLNEIMEEHTIEELNVKKVSKRIKNESLSFWAPKFSLVFRDYNHDGNIDFNLGQYGSCAGNNYWLFTISKKGKIAPILVDGTIDYFNTSDPGHINSTDDPLLELDHGLLKYSTYNRQVDIEYTTWYKWDGKQLTSVKSKKVCFKNGEEVEMVNCEN